MSAAGENDILELLETLSSLEVKLLDFEKAFEVGTDYSELVHIMFRLAHNLKSGLGFAGKELCSQLIHSVENTLDRLRSGKGEPNLELIDNWLVSVDLIKNHIYDEYEYETDFHELIDKLHKYLEAAPESSGLKKAALTFPLDKEQFKIYQKSLKEKKKIYQLEKLVQTKISREVYLDLPVYDDIKEAGTFIAAFPPYEMIDKNEPEALVKIVFASDLSPAELEEILFDPFCMIDPASKVSIGTFESNASADNTPVGQAGLDNEVYDRFLSEGTDILNHCEQEILELEKDYSKRSIIDVLFRSIHTLKGNAGLLKLPEMEAAGTAFENLLSPIRDHQERLDAKTIAAMLKLVDLLRSQMDIVAGVTLFPDSGGYKRKYIGEILVELGKTTEEDIEKALDIQVMPLGEVLVEKGVVDKLSIEEALRVQEKINSKVPSEVKHKKKYIRVDVEKLDMMFDFIGELVTAGNIVENKLKLLESLLNIDFSGFMKTIEDFEHTTRDLNELSQNADKVSPGELVSKFQKTVRSVSSRAAHARNVAARNNDYMELINELNTQNFSSSFTRISKIIKDLQEVSTKTRMIPLEDLFNKMVRLVRDLSKKSKKKINFSVSGQDTEMDKNIIEMIQDPLIHILRNAIDHGIEEPKMRLAEGKAEAASINLDACYEGSEIWITIKDDGKGFDRDRILKRAIEKNLVGADGDSLSDEAVWNLVFEPGFSTAEKITQISGRGVGMDVVKKNIEKLRGKIEIASTKGQGTRVILQIPLTLAIIEGITVKVGGGLYTIPLSDIYEFFQAKQSQITRTDAGNLVLKLRDEVLPLIRLSAFFKTEGKGITEGIILVVQHRERRVCFLIDEIIGNQQIVIKSLKEYLGDLAGIAGCTILGNGDVSLILDTNRIIDRFL